MPYWLVVQAAVAWLVVQYARSRDGPVRRKCLVIGLTAVTLLAPRLGPTMSIPAALLQLALGVCLALRRMVLTPDAGAQGVSPTRPPHQAGPFAEPGV